MIAVGEDPTAGDYVGRDVASSAPELQSVTHAIGVGQSESFSVKVIKGGTSEDVILRASSTLDDWNPHIWNIEYFDGNTNITGALTGAGWKRLMFDGESVELTVKLTPPANATANERLEVRVSAQIENDDGSIAEQDVVRAVAYAKTAPARPDVAIGRLSSAGVAHSYCSNWVVSQGWERGLRTLPNTDRNSFGSGRKPRRSPYHTTQLEHYTGQNEFSPTAQQLTSVVGEGMTESFALQITNSSNNASAFQLQGATLPEGWEWKFYDALQNGVALAWDDDGNIITPTIEAGKSLSLRVEVTASDGAGQAVLPLRVSDGGLFDQCEINAQVQSLAGLQWSRDGQSWQAVSGTTLLQIEQQATLGIRALKAKPDLPWPDAHVMGPAWGWQGTELEGETMWLQGQSVTAAGGETATATLKKALAAKIRVLPEYEVSLGVSNPNLMAGAGPQALNTATISARVATESNAPLANQRVRLRALHEDQTPAGSWKGGQAEPILTTDAQGAVALQWTSDAVEGEVSFEATLVTDGVPARERSSQISLNVNAPYATVELGAWNEDANGWSRSVKATTWFGGQKIAGLTVKLSSQLFDYETEAPVVGWEGAAPFDTATGLSDVKAQFTTTQRWNPVEAGAWPHDYEVTVGASIS